jgi:hypothetical protein
MRGAVATAAALCLLTACTASTSGNAGTPVGTPTPSGPPPVVDGFPTGGPQLLALLQQGARSVHSSHFVQRIDVGGVVSTGPGDQVYRNGTLLGFRENATYPHHQTLAIRVVGHPAWAQFPRSLLTTAKRWTVLRPDSHNRLVRIFSAALPGSTDLPAPGTASTLAAVSDSTTFVAVTSLDGTEVEHLKLAVDVTRAARTYRPAASLHKAGLSTLPTDVWIDRQGRTRKIEQTVTAQGSTTKSATVLSRYNQHVLIHPPPKRQVGTV